MSTRCGRQLSSLARGRRLVLVDIENIAGGACATAGPVRRVKKTLRDVLRVSDNDHVVVGTSHIGLLEVGTNWAGVRYVVRSGANGADMALLDVLTEHIPLRYEELILASGDGIFAPAVAALAAAGVTTTVVGRRGTIARSLQMAAYRVLQLDAGPPASGPRAVA